MLKNTSPVPLRVSMEINSREPGVTLEVISPSRPVKLIAKRSLPDTLEQRQIRVPIGVARVQAYYDNLLWEASQIDISSLWEE